ncbi:MAG: UvrD-helicase domain-containing protein [Syntrophobacteraceae bacterium]
MFDTLSETQRRVVFEKEGKFVVRACPGSGKTYSVAARLADRMCKWPLNHQGIAAISFTNAAWQEIERQVTTHFNIAKPIPYPHFLGTIDSFVNRFIFLPFGHLIMKCSDRPILVGEPHGPWSGKAFTDSLFPNLTYDINGNIYPINKRAMPQKWENNKYIIPAKRRLIRAGYANQDDANYFAMKVLETYPNVAKAIIHRFPSFMVDEAQDTSEIQMRTIDLLIDNGLENIMLVGDPDQAIFEWHGAKPHLFVEKFNAWKENSILLNENRRCSQNICDCTCRLSSLERTSTAINEDVKECSFIPIVRTYDIDNTDELLKYFRNLCFDFNIDVTPENAAVIFRSNNIFNAIIGIKEIGFNNEPWEDMCSYAKDFAKGKYLFCHGYFRSGFRLIEKATIKALGGSHYCSKSELERVVKLKGFVNFRKEVYELLSMLPDATSTIGEWIVGANKIFKENNIEIDLKIKNSKGYISFDQLFASDDKNITASDCRIGTIHSIKGETFEAVLVILKTKGIGSLYKTMLNNNIPISNEEELRIVYVGITRPRRLLVLAVPDEENKAAWVSRLFG